MPLIGFTVAKYGQMNRRFSKSGKLQPGIERSPVRLVSVQRDPVFRLEPGDDPCLSIGVLYQNDTPWLTVSDRRREVCKVKEPVQQAIRKPLCAKSAHIPAPVQQRLERLFEAFIKYGRHLPFG